MAATILLWTSFPDRLSARVKPGGHHGSHLEKTAACFTASSSAVSQWGRSMPNWLPTRALPVAPALLPCRNSRTALGLLVRSPPPRDLPSGKLLSSSGSGAETAASRPKKLACRMDAFSAWHQSDHSCASLHIHETVLKGVAVQSALLQGRICARKLSTPMPSTAERCRPWHHARRETRDRPVDCADGLGSPAEALRGLLFSCCACFALPEPWAGPWAAELMGSMLAAPDRSGSGSLAGCLDLPASHNPYHVTCLLVPHSTLALHTWL